MMKKSKFSIFAQQQQLGRPGTTVFFAVFALGYLLYLCVLLGINAQKGWATATTVAFRIPTAPRRT